MVVGDSVAWCGNGERAIVNALILVECAISLRLYLLLEVSIAADLHSDVFTAFVGLQVVLNRAATFSFDIVETVRGDLGF